MSISISIDKLAIRGVRGEYANKKFYVTQCVTIPLEDELSRGRIVNQEGFQDKLRKLRDQMKIGNERVRVVLSYASVISQAVETPALGTKALYRVAKEELNEFVGNEEQFIYDYYLYNTTPEGNYQILCVAMEKNVINDFKQAFTKCHMKLGSLDIDQSAQYKIMKSLQGMENKTFILGSLVGNRFRASLYDGSEFCQNSRARLTHRDNIGVVAEISSCISSLGQFNKSRRTDKDVSQVLISGMWEKEQDFISNISNAVGIPTTLVNGEMFGIQTKLIGNVCQEYFYAIGNLQEGKKDIDFLRAKVTGEKKASNWTSTKIVTLIIPLAMILLVMMIMGTLFVQTKLCEQEINHINEQMTDSQSQVEEVAVQSTAVGELTKFKAKVDAATASAIGVTQVDKNILNTIVKKAGKDVTIRHLTYDGVSLLVEGVTANIDAPAKFAYNMRTTALFREVNYTGYAKDDTGYTFTVSLELQ